MNILMKIVQQYVADGLMAELYKSESGVMVVGAWGRDAGTLELRLKLTVVYPDGEVSPIREYAKRKLTEAKALNDLADLDGIAPKMVPEIFKAVMRKQDAIPVQKDRSGNCSVSQAYKALCEYVRDYEEPGRVFVRDGYGHILASYLPSVIDRLELGFSRLDLQKNFKAWGLLRVSEKTGHVYSYAIKIGSANDWFFSFKLPEESEAAA